MHIRIILITCPVIIETDHLDDQFHANMHFSFFVDYIVPYVCESEDSESLLE